MGDPARRLPTFDELYREIQRLERGLTGEILEPGVLRVMSRPGRRHRKAHKVIVDALRDRDADRGGAGWWIELEPEVRFGDLLSVPDLAGWRVERVPDLPEENPLVVAPDWVCEVLSPSTERDDRRLKLPLYARSGVRHVWLVDAQRRLVEVFETIDGRPTLVASAADDEVLALPPFDELSFALTSWWSPHRDPA